MESSAYLYQVQTLELDRNSCIIDLILQINKAHEKRWKPFAMAEMESMAYLYQLQTLEVAENYLVSVFVQWT